jgi:hypothetical protein
MQMLMEEKKKEVEDMLKVLAVKEKDQNAKEQEVQAKVEEKKKEVEDMLEKLAVKEKLLKAKEEQLKAKEDAIKTLQAQLKNKNHCIDMLVLLCVLLLMTMVVILFNGK